MTDGRRKKGGLSAAPEGALARPDSRTGLWNPAEASKLAFDVGFLPLGLAVFLLNFSDNAVTAAFHIGKIVVREIPPLLLDLTLHLSPIALHLIPNRLFAVCTAVFVVRVLHRVASFKSGRSTW